MGEGTRVGRRAVRTPRMVTALALALVEIPASVRAATHSSHGPSGPESSHGPSGPEAPRDEQPVEVVDAKKPVAPIDVVLPQAQRLADAGQFVEAARIYEAQWQATGDARFLFQAALLRARAGQHAIALRQLDQCVAGMTAQLGELPEAIRRPLEEARQRELAATVPTRLRLVESTAGGLAAVPEHLLAGGRVRLTQPRLPGGHVSKDSIEVAPGAELRLDVGEWTAEVEVPGFAPVVVRHTIVTEGAWEIVIARRKLVVDVRVSPENAIRDARLLLRAGDHASQLAIERPLSGPTTTVTLTPGPWHLEVRARRHEAIMDLTVGPDQKAIAVELRRRQPGDDQRIERDRKLVFALLGTVVVSYFGGVGLILGGTNREKRAHKLDAEAYEAAGLDPEMPEPITPDISAAIEAAYPRARFYRDLERANDLHTAGIVVAGVAIGTAGSALPIALRARRRVLAIELGVGAAVVGTAAGWLWWSLGQREQVLAAPERAREQQLDRTDGHRIASSMFLGAGIGLVAFTSVTLLTDLARRRKRERSFGAAPLAGPGLAGLMLRGRF